MKFLDIRSLSLKDLKNNINLQERNYQNVKIEHTVRLKKNPMEIRMLRRNVARLKTELNKRINERRKSKEKK
ncbi:50S ribosomal protein L29 [Blattabacterium cuenoti]|uniref:50S ribosomal protein L29 n=1 Tax=Blattabacterium cuenoti TaxID=1653831 RepID=UPI00163D2B79|nr:50S ribosomal protein L29 [Blattabacterium cuenoti]